MMKQAQFWRLVLSLPVLLGAVWVAGFHLAGAQLTPPTPVESTIFGFGLMVAQFVVLMFRAGVGFAFLIWLLVFLWWTRRDDGEQLERAVWFAPLAFSPSLLIVVPVAILLQEQEYYGGEAVVVLEAVLGGIWLAFLALVFGYLLVVLAWATKRACQRFHLVAHAS